MKYIKFTITLLLAFPLALFAANDVTLTQDQVTISVNGVNLNIAAQDAVLDSITVDSASFTLTMSGSSYAKISSGARKKLTPNETALVLQSICDDTESALRIGGPASGTKTIRIDVSTDSCSGSSSSGSGGGGSVIGVTGGGGGGGTYTPSPTAVSAPHPATPAVPGVGPAVPAIPSPSAQPSARALLVSPAFNRTLKVGMTHADVKRLQELLNSDPNTRITESGVGSPGHETDYFGAKTAKAVEKFQIKHGIVSSGSPETTGFGAVGPATRAKLAEVFSNATPRAPSVAQPSAVAVSVSPVFTRGLDVGSQGEDVKRLQQVLNSDLDTRIANTGTGSPGNETTTFGALTRAAVARFQMKHGLVTSPTDTGYGFVGPKTRTKLQEVFGGMHSPQSIPGPTLSPTTTNDTAVRAAIEQQIKAALSAIQKLQADIAAQGGQ